MMCWMLNSSFMVFVVIWWKCVMFILMFGCVCVSWWGCWKIVIWWCWLFILVLVKDVCRLLLLLDSYWLVCFVLGYCL